MRIVIIIYLPKILTRQIISNNFLHLFVKTGAGYHNVAKALASEGMLAFGHDHAGHGQSEGIPAYIDSVDDYVDDLVDHCLV